MIRPQLVELRNRILNARQFPHLMHLRVAACSLQRMPSFFYKRNMAPKGNQ